MSLLEVIVATAIFTVVAMMVSTQVTANAKHTQRMTVDARAEAVRNQIRIHLSCEHNDELQTSTAGDFVDLRNSKGKVFMRGEAKVAGVPVEVRCGPFPCSFTVHAELKKNMGEKKPQLTNLFDLLRGCYQ